MTRPSARLEFLAARLRYVHAMHAEGRSIEDIASAVDLEHDLMRIRLFLLTDPRSLDALLHQPAPARAGREAIARWLVERFRPRYAAWDKLSDGIRNECLGEADDLLAALGAGR